MQSTLQTAGCELAVMLSLFEKIHYIDLPGMTCAMRLLMIRNCRQAKKNTGDSWLHWATPLQSFEHDGA